MQNDRPSAAVDSSERLAIEHWLLTVPQLQDGPHQGGVAGSLDERGEPLYVYPEITGYYLQWLAWQCSRSAASHTLSSRADAARRWIVSWLAASSPPCTRIHLAAGTEDWRNSFLFCFDLAMVLRGIASAAHAGLLVPGAAAVKQLDVHLRALIDSDGMFVACRSSAGTPPPQRWSTRRGAFLAKAATGIVHAADRLSGVSATVRDAAEATLAATVRSLFEDTPHADVHALLYAIEGALCTTAIPPRVVDRCIHHVDLLLCAVRRTGRLFESAFSDVERVDIAAQLLRACMILAAISRTWQPDRRSLETLQHAIEGSVLTSGGVPFTVLGSAPNVWAAMFAEQALAFCQGSPHQVRDWVPLLV